MENKIAHLGFIQGIINRMGQNSFFLKGWSITIISALFVLSSKDSNKSYILVAYFPALMFWSLDAYFLYQEKLFRKLYDKVASNQLPSDEFTLETSLIKKEVESIFCVFFSITIFGFHGVVVAVILFVIFGINPAN